MNKELRTILAELGIFEKKFVKTEDIKNYPPDQLVQQNEYFNYYIDDKEMSDQEIILSIMAKQTSHLNVIKNIMIFNLIVSLIAACLSIFSFL